ncbi:Bgt-3379 [Blumeria graminis f. sp. tritici]|uniref:Bgt-3379 n=1 Tax=Blumeria graminis f. sp. tritici TaxID=62690 RepID=A0A9X9MHC3_BLUGR|nr:Bgt-3379 [Blumeria graminis f. sp. tritici]
MTNADPVATLLKDYHELNPGWVEIRTTTPTPLEFMRFVARNRPFVVRGGAADWQATREWSVARLKALLQGQTVEVAVTPNGLADAPTRDADGQLCFVKPWQQRVDFAEFIDSLLAPETRTGSEPPPPSEVTYAQSRSRRAENDNLRHEYELLAPQLPTEIAWARDALGQPADARNLWIGNAHSTTVLHKDPYENIYVQLLGRKHFRLLPPCALVCVAETPLPPAAYLKSPSGTWRIRHEPGPPVPLPTWDPDAGPAQAQRTPYSHLVVPLAVTLEKGDMLYLPAQWYHKVSQSCADDGICCAVNYWYDMEYGGGSYSMLNFLRNVTSPPEPQDPLRPIAVYHDKSRDHSRS